MTKYYLICFAVLGVLFHSCQTQEDTTKRKYNEKYVGEYTRKIAFPIGGLGTGMFCVEGTGALSNMSVRHRPNVFNEPTMFAAIHVEGYEHGTRILEGPVPEWKKFGAPNSSRGDGGSWGMPRFKDFSFQSRFPFAEINLADRNVPVDVKLTAWNPFVPTDEDNSSLPVAGIEYEFHNTSDKEVQAIFSYNSMNFMQTPGKGKAYIDAAKNGFILRQTGTEDEPFCQGDFMIYTDEPQTVVNCNWFRGGWFDPLSICWNNLEEGKMETNQPGLDGAVGASLYVPFTLKAGETRNLKLFMAWYVPYSHERIGGTPKTDTDIPDTPVCPDSTDSCFPYENKFEETYRPWYSSKFDNIQAVADYWQENYNSLKEKTQLFTDAFYSSTLPAEVKEAVAANLSILKSTTVLRQYDGRMWNWEGSHDNWGSCHGSCTHVWNYAQAVSHLFPRLERTLRETEFFVSQDKKGHQVFRTNLPISPTVHDFHSAADGQLGGIMKVYREWRIQGDTNWLKMMYPAVKKSMDYCIQTWDPREVGAIEEPHHNTYDIEFWGANGMITSFYAGALQAICLMGKTLGDDVSYYEALMNKSKIYLENKLFDGEYFVQNIQWTGLNAPDPVSAQSFVTHYTPEALKILKEEGPKYQYGKGCLSDGILGSWMTLVCGMPEIVDREKVKSHLNSVHKYNFKKDLTNHVNPQRSTFALGEDGGLLLCTWPKGGKLKLPFVYSNEVWTGIEYQVAAHLMFEGEIKKGLEIVRTCRDRYNGRVRNPYNEYECGAWYARAMASYAMLEGLTGIRYDAVEKTLYIDSRIGNDFTSFLSTETGFGNVGLRGGKPFIEVKFGKMEVQKCIVSGVEIPIMI